MKINRTLLFYLLIFSLILVSCQEEESTHTDWIQVSQEFENNLVQTKIEGVNLSMAIPPNTKFSKSQGPDFDVYYLAPIDSLTELDFHGGLYLGNHPSLFPYEDTTCERGIVKSPIFDQVEDWQAILCDSLKKAQVIVKSNSNIGWMEYVHAFGATKTDSGFYKLMKVLSTLKSDTSKHGR